MRGGFFKGLGGLGVEDSILLLARFLLSGDSL